MRGISRWIPRAQGALGIPYEIVDVAVNIQISKFLIYCLVVIE